MAEDLMTLSSRSKGTIPLTIIAGMWLLFGIEVILMAVLFLKGEGRGCVVEAKEGLDDHEVEDMDDVVCTEGVGSSGVSVGFFFRAIAAFAAQLITLFVTDLGVLIPFEAMWMCMIYIMNRVGGCVGSPNDYAGTTHITYSDGSRRTEHDSGCCSCFMMWILCSVLPIWVIGIFTVAPARVYLSAVCYLVTQHGEVLYWFVLGYYLFLMVSMPLINCRYGDGHMSKEVVRAFVAADAVVIGISFVWANYVQSGIVAFFFGLLPAFTICLKLFECCTSGGEELTEDGDPRPNRSVGGDTEGVEVL